MRGGKWKWEYVQNLRKYADRVANMALSIKLPEFHSASPMLLSVVSEFLNDRDIEKLAELQENIESLRSSVRNAVNAALHFRDFIYNLPLTDFTYNQLKVLRRRLQELEKDIWQLKKECDKLYKEYWSLVNKIENKYGRRLRYIIRDVLPEIYRNGDFLDALEEVLGV